MGHLQVFKRAVAITKSGSLLSAAPLPPAEVREHVDQPVAAEGHRFPPGVPFDELVHLENETAQ